MVNLLSPWRPATISSVLLRTGCIYQHRHHQLAKTTLCRASTHFAITSARRSSQNIWKRNIVNQRVTYKYRSPWNTLPRPSPCRITSSDRKVYHSRRRKEFQLLLLMPLLTWSPSSLNVISFSWVLFSSSYLSPAFNALTL